jgi:hypothetical protein
VLNKIYDYFVNWVDFLKRKRNEKWTFSILRSLKHFYLFRTDGDGPATRPTQVTSGGPSRKKKKKNLNSKQAAKLNPKIWRVFHFEKV